MSILAEIFAQKRQEVALARREMPLAKVQAAAAQAAPALDFTAALDITGQVILDAIQGKDVEASAKKAAELMDKKMER